jgi:hypothetical protein
VSGSTIGGSTSQQPSTAIVDTEMEILAHLWWLLFYVSHPTCGQWPLFCSCSDEKLWLAIHSLTE